MSAILLVGEVQVGKSTLIRRALDEYPDLRLGGFRTVSRKLDVERMGVYLLRADENINKENYPRERLVGLRYPKERRREGYPEVFDSMAGKLFQNGDILLMDELGGMEAESLKFQAEVLNALQGNVPVLGVIKPINSPFLDSVRALPQVQLMTVTKENRDELADVLIKKLAEELKL